MTNVTLFLDTSGLNDWVGDTASLWVRESLSNLADVENLRAKGLIITTLSGFKLDRWGINDMMDDIELHHDDLARVSVIWRGAAPGEKAALSAAVTPRRFQIDWI